MTPASTESPLLPGLHRFTRMERVHWGRPVATVLPEELRLLQCRRAFIVTNRSLARSPGLERLSAALGLANCGRYDAVRSHAPRDCVIDAAQAARGAGADLLIAFGGGSVIDATKAVALCLRHDVRSSDALDAFAGARPPDLGRVPEDAPLWIRSIAVPTTLSGAEFAASAGLTDERRRMKEPFVHPMQMPVSVVLDPEMTLSAPLALLKSTGMKAIDHAVERMTSKAANPYSDAVSALALEMLAAGLRGLGEATSDLALRSKLQYGMFMSLAGSASGVAVNVSHAIGHVLGGHAGVEHGQTTGLVLPAVLRWNRPETEAAQQGIAMLIGGGAEAADAVANLALELGLPTRLRDVGLQRDDLDAIAAKTMHEHLLQNSRRPVLREDVDAILASAW